ncbi:MAG: YheC/YheD family protein [Syntrophomonadaceae bacterium]|jgi:glutathione synthase/RimK-type ligase-like ATP-grasp enzyme/antitoxin component of MazEF toxin-antitoxin module|nr:YheC/YheD family protein [Syntrophomonadaceae bacterium]
MPENHSIIYISGNVCTRLGVTPGQSVTVTVGNKSARAKIVKKRDSELEDETVSLSERLSAALNIPSGIKLGVTRADNKLKVGPLIGILAKQYQNGVFGQDSFYRKLLAQLKKLTCIGIVFTPQSIDWERKMIHGYYLPNGVTNKWARRWFPFPDIVYNRYFRKDGDPWSYPILKRMQKSGVKSFNAPMGSKWKIHRLLNRDGEIRAHIPETQVLTAVNVLKEMLRKHHQVYVKPAGGFQGKGITRVRKSNGTYMCQGTTDMQEYKYTDINRVYRRTRSAAKSKIMLVQQAITCPSRIGHFDVRAMVQKDHTDKWNITGLAARVGGKGRVTTNLHTGGKPERLDSVLAACGFRDSEITEIISSINKLSLKIAGTLEKYITPIGEIGLDFIIDTTGRVWFLEANSKPGRRAFSQMELNKDERLSIIRPMLYARYLAGFREGE